MSSIGAVIRKLRIQKGLSVEKTSEMSHFPESYIRNLESGKRVRISIQMIEKLVPVLGPELIFEYLNISPILTHDIPISIQNENHYELATVGKFSLSDKECRDFFKQLDDTLTKLGDAANWKENGKIRVVVFADYQSDSK